jgi:hypothetical protein
MANSNDAILMDLSDAAEVIDFEYVFNAKDMRAHDANERLQRARKYELLVPDRIPRELLILNSDDFKRFSLSRKMASSIRSSPRS